MTKQEQSELSALRTQVAQLRHIVVELTRALRSPMYEVGRGVIRMAVEIELSEERQMEETARCK
jgi:hypothetical protein